MTAALAGLRPGGQMVIWLYGAEGNRLYLAFVVPLRAITKRLPDPMLRGLAWGLAMPLRAYIAACRWLPLPMHRYMRRVLRQLTMRQLVLNVFDQLNPTYAKYYTQSEASELLENAGFTEVTTHHHHGYSWTVRGTKAGSSSATNYPAD